MLTESYARYENIFAAIEVHLNGKPNDRWARYPRKHLATSSKVQS